MTELDVFRGGLKLHVFWFANDQKLFEISEVFANFK